MARLILLRHATAVSGAADASRHLAARGRQEARRVGLTLVEKGWLPDLALCSTAVRACQTFDEVVVGTDGALDPARGQQEPRLYLASPEGLLGCIAEVQEATATLLVVAHNPGIFDLARGLAEHDATPDGSAKGSAEHAAERRAALARGFPPASMAFYEVAGPWASLAPATAQLVDVIRPD
jgi:phosphohistidine phosphatase